MANFLVFPKKRHEHISKYIWWIMPTASSFPHSFSSRLHDLIIVDLTCHYLYSYSHFRLFICKQTTENKWRWISITIIMIRMVLVCVMLASVMGTSLDLFFIRGSVSTNKNNNNLPLDERTLSSLKRCLLSFSIPRNFHLIFNTDKVGDSHLGCLHGFRVLTMGWVVMGHTYALTNHQAFGKHT